MSLNFHHVVTKFGFFFQRFLQKSRMSNSTEIRPVGTALINVDRLTDRQTNMTKLTEAFRDYAKTPNKTDF